MFYYTIKSQQGQLSYNKIMKNPPAKDGFLYVLLKPS